MFLLSTPRTTTKATIPAILSPILYRKDQRHPLGPRSSWEINWYARALLPIRTHGAARRPPKNRYVTAFSITDQRAQGSDKFRFPDLGRGIAHGGRAHPTTNGGGHRGRIAPGDSKASPIFPAEASICIQAERLSWKAAREAFAKNGPSNLGVWPGHWRSASLVLDGTPVRLSGSGFRPRHVQGQRASGYSTDYENGREPLRPAAPHGFPPTGSFPTVLDRLP